jgi:hypothetical protein
MDSEYIFQAVKTYIETPDTRYAIMIDGEWGCGKTYLWSDCISPEIGKDKSLYISLFGLKDNNDIENEIFKALSSMGTEHGNILKGLLNSNPEVVEGVRFGGIGLAVQFGLKKWKDTKLDKSKSLFICFDDFERWAGDIGECLSYINKLVEIEGAKCLVIGNVKGLKGENRNRFNETREKSIRFKYLLSHSSSKALDAAINLAHFEDEDCEEYVKRLYRDHSKRLCELIDFSKCYNIRTLSNAFYYLSVIYLTVPNSPLGGLKPPSERARTGADRCDP